MSQVNRASRILKELNGLTVDQLNELSSEIVAKDFRVAKTFSVSIAKSIIQNKVFKEPE